MAHARAGEAHRHDSPAVAVSATAVPAGSRARRLAWAPVLLLIRAYQRLISPVFAGHCRFTPSCSEYAHEAIARHGGKGLWLAVRRLARCHPLGAHGFDPVPAEPARRTGRGAANAAGRRS
jgi:putative membrane protein insertion efficiency factor